MVVSVIVPAHDEAAVIGRCLDALASPEGGNDLEVVVVCNGCSDATEQIARAHPSGARVAAIPEASKVAALNHGDELASGYPRFYVDADVTISGEAVRSLAQAMERRAASLVAPGLSYDLRASTAPVRSHYRIWLRLPSVRDEPIGRGVYGLSREARARFGPFPDVVADDHFVRDLFPPQQRLVVHDAVSEVVAPRTLPDLLRRKMRVYASNADLDRRTGEGRARGARRRRQWLGVVRTEPRLIWDLPAYLLVSVLPRLEIMWRRLRGHDIGWQRDKSSRTPGRA